VVLSLPKEPTHFCTLAPDCLDVADSTKKVFASFFKKDVLAFYSDPARRRRTARQVRYLPPPSPLKRDATQPCRGAALRV
jgi:hypothetical protein